MPMVTQVTATYADLHTWDNLYAAYRKAAKGKRGRAAAAAFEYRLEDNLIQLAGRTGDGDLPARPLRQLHHPRTQAPPDQRRALSRSRRPPCPLPGHRTGLRAQLHPPLLRQPRRQGHPPGAGHLPALGQALSLRAPVRRAPVLSRPSTTASCSDIAQPPHPGRRHPAPDRADPGQRRRRAERGVRDGLLSRRRPLCRQPAARACPSAT